jgi:hypothetical protein
VEEAELGEKDVIITLAEHERSSNKCQSPGLSALNAQVGTFASIIKCDSAIPISNVGKSADLSNVL